MDSLSFSFANLNMVFGALTGSSDTAIAVGPEKRSIIFSYLVSLSANFIILFLAT